LARFYTTQGNAHTEREEGGRGKRSRSRMKSRRSRRMKSRREEN
jgi:hypothetical protein